MSQFTYNAGFPIPADSILEITPDSGIQVVPDGSGNVNIVGSGNITTVGTANTLTIEFTGSLFSWNVVTGSTQDLVAANGYFSNNATSVTYTLPTGADVGDTFQVVAMHASGTFIVGANTGQTMYIGNTATTTTTGTLTSTDTGDWIEIVCRVADTDFQVNVKQGNITVT